MNSNQKPFNRRVVLAGIAITLLVMIGLSAAADRLNQDIAATAQTATVQSDEHPHPGFFIFTITQTLVR